MEKEKIIKHYGGNRALKCIPSPWKIVKRLGRGAYGEVFLIQKENTKRVVKFQKNPNVYDILYEVWMQINFYKCGLAPKIYHFDIWGNEFSSITMGYIDMLEDYLSIKRNQDELNDIVNKLELLLDVMCQHKMRHNDLHWGNIGIDKYLNLVLIDFGQASIYHKKCYKSGEWFQLARTLRNKLQLNMNRNTKEYLSGLILNRFLKSMQDENIVLSKTIKSVEDLYNVMDEAVGYLRPTSRYKKQVIQSLNQKEKKELSSKKL